MQKCKIGLDLVCFELKTAKSAKSIGRASYAEAKKSAERGSKRRIELQKGGWHFVYVIAASLSVLKPAEFAVFCDRGFGFRNGIGERLLQKAVAFGVFCVPKPL